MDVNNSITVWMAVWRVSWLWQYWYPVNDIIWLETVTYQKGVHIAKTVSMSVLDSLTYVLEYPKKDKKN